MPIYHRDVAQYSEQYDKLKLGIPTSSNFFRIVSPTGKKSKQWLDYAHHLLAERWYQRRDHTYTSPHMERGLREEEFAVDWYAYDKGLQPGDPDFPALIGFITDDARTMGCTPDRLVGEDGLVELKCPAAPAQFGYLLQGIDTTFKPQLQGQLLISQRVWVDNVAWHDDLPKLAIRVERDDRFARLLEAELASFVDYLENSWAAIQAKLEPGRPLEISTSRPRQGPSAPLKAQLEAALAYEDKTRSAATVEAQTEVVGDRPMPGVLPHREPGETSAPLEQSGSREPQTPSVELGANSRRTSGGERQTWTCGTAGCGMVFDSYSIFSKHRQRTGHKADTAHRDPKRAEAVDPEPKPTEPAIRGVDVAGSSSEAEARQTGPAADQHGGPVRAPTGKPAETRREAGGSPALRDEETFWDIAARTGDYRAEIPDKNIATLGRDTMMNLVSIAPTVEALTAFYQGNLATIEAMGKVRVASRNEVVKAMTRRKKQLEGE